MKAEVRSCVDAAFDKKGMKKPASAEAKKAMKKPAAMKAEVHSCVDVVKVKYTNMYRCPVGTYCQAFVDGKWQHVVTVQERQHAKHADIVKHIGAQVQSGKLSLDDRG